MVVLPEPLDGAAIMKLAFISAKVRLSERKAKFI